MVSAKSKWHCEYYTNPLIQDRIHSLNRPVTLFITPGRLVASNIQGLMLPTKNIWTINSSNSAEITKSKLAYWPLRQLEEPYQKPNMCLKDPKLSRPTVNQMTILERMAKRYQVTFTNRTAISQIVVIYIKGIDKTRFMCLTSLRNLLFRN